MLGQPEITVCIMPGIIACQTTQIKDLIVVDYLVNLLMPLTSIAGANVPGFFSSSFLLSSLIGEV